MSLVKRGVRTGFLRLLSDDQIEQIHFATTEVLEEVGIKSESKRILNIFKENGADVDLEEKRVKIPQHLVKEALKKAPQQFKLYGRNSKYDMILENHRTYFGLGSVPTPYILDIDTGEYRRPTKKDVEESTRLGDALPNMDYIMTIAGAFDVPYQVEYLHEWDAMFNNTEKPIVMAAPGSYTAKKVIQMASAISGDENTLRKKPILSIYSETISPLIFTLEDEAMIESALANVPVTLLPNAMVGITGPATLIGTMVVNNAENLAAITLIQLTNSHAPVISYSGIAVMDPRTVQFLHAAPEVVLADSVFNSQMARFYGLPNFGYCGTTSSKLPDAQAGAEVTMHALMGALSGVTLMHDCGYLADAMVGSMEMAAICDEVIGIVKRIIRGAEINDETLAVDVIKEIGPGGHFTSHKHTLKHMREELHIANLFERSSYETWIKNGKKDIREKARERVKKLLEKHYPETLPINVKQRLSEIIKQAEKDLIK